MTTSVSAASAAVFRIGFGVVAFVLVLRFFVRGWIDSLILDPRYHFSYPGFDWIVPLPRPLMYGHFVLLGAAALAIALGIRQRLAAAVFAVGFAYVELIDRTNYLNHYYWVVLTAALLAFVPLSGLWSVDARLGRVQSSPTVQLWIIWLLRFQVGMVYFFAGLAKLNSEWLFQAQPLATWLPARSDLLVVGPLLAAPMTAFAFSWLGALFDLTIVGWLSFPRTRLPAFLALVGFHTATWVLFPSIGLFPLLMSISALIFFPPDWPAKLIGHPNEDRREPREASPRHRPLRPLGVAIAGIYILAMTLIPLRHHLIHEDAGWTGDGYLFSWQVMLNEKSGSADFRATDEAGGTWIVGLDDYLTQRQIAVMATDPALMQQTALLIATDLGVAVSVDARLSYNGRPSVQYTNPDVLIAPTTLPRSEWVLEAPWREVATAAISLPDRPDE